MIHGRVHDEANQPIAHAVVAMGAVFGETDANGAFALEVGTRTGIVWVRVPEGYVPGPVWAAWPGPVELVVKKLAKPATQPLRFVVGSDAHLSEAQTSNGANDLALAIRHAIDHVVDHAPAFFTVLGDVTQGGTDDQFDMVEEALPELLGVPWVPVPGNHDWYDGGVAWTKRAGPDNYSFDLAGAHFVVWNMALTEAQILAFLRGDLARAKAPIIALTHAPPSATVLAVLAQAHVAYVLTGHAHSNRVVHHEGGITEFNTEPLLMGGLDFTPAGYRIFTLDHDQLHSQHEVTVDRPIVSILAPRCVHDELLVAATSSPVVARIDGGTPITMRSIGGWDWRAELALAPGPHRVEVGTTTATIHACPPLAAPSGGLTTELATRWITPVNGHLLSARPVIANGTIFATVTDLGDGDSGGVIAIDLATGTVRWRTALPIQTRGGVAVVGTIVAVPRIDGVIVGLDATTGSERWTHELRPHTAPEAQATFASITADGEDVLIGHQRAFAVLAAADGHVRWQTDPVPEGENSQSLAAVAVGDGIVVGTFNRAFGGVQAWDRATGQPLWQVDSAETIAINATPVIADHTVFVVNAADQVTAIELATGRIAWRAPLDPAGFEWGNATIGTPAYAHGILIVPTLYRDLVALDAHTGAELWRHHALPSPIRATHYRGANEAGYEASPIIADDRVWIADTSGELAGLDVKTGAPLFRTAIGAPVLAGLAVSGANLVVASFDGSIRALSPAPPLPHISPPIGCASTTPDLFGLVLVLAFIRSRRC